MKTQPPRNTAIDWIEGEMSQFLINIGEKNAASAVRSCIDLALLLDAITTGDHAHYRERVSRAYTSFNAQGAAA